MLQTTVQPDSPADGKTLGELDLKGMAPLARSRKGRWQYRPRGRTRLMEGDRLLLIGRSDSAEHLQWLFGEQEYED